MAVTEFTCFLCHFRGQVDVANPKGQDFCLQCHDYPNYLLSVSDTNFDHSRFVERGVSCQRCHIDVVEGDGMVEDRACLQCHSDPEQLERIGDVEEVHINHVTNHKVECFNCHANIDHKVVEHHGPAPVSCDSCHAETHMGPRQLYAGVGGRGVPDMPSVMYKAQVDCIGCHLSEMDFGDDYLIKGRTKETGVESCEGCHGETGRQVFEIWTKELKAQLSKSSELLDQAMRHLERGLVADENREDAQQLVNDAAFNFNLVKQGRGIHNFTYSLELLLKVQENSKSVLEL
jgi:hypothetical protein